MKRWTRLWNVIFWALSIRRFRYVDGSYGSGTKPQPVESPVPEYWKDNYLNPDLAAKLMVWACERISGLWMLVHEEIQLALLAFFHFFPQIRGFILVILSPLLSWDHETLRCTDMSGHVWFYSLGHPQKSWLGASEFDPWAWLGMFVGCLTLSMWTWWHRFDECWWMTVFP